MSCLEQDALNRWRLECAAHDATRVSRDASEAECARLRNEVYLHQRAALQSHGPCFSQIEAWKSMHAAEQRAHAETQAALEARMHPETAKAIETQNARLKGELQASEAECARLRELNSNIIEERRAYARDLAAEQRAHQATQRAWATHLLIRDGNYSGSLTEPVAAMVRQYAGHPMGPCNRCGKTAPQVRKNNAVRRGAGGQGVTFWMECAWGCEPEEKS